mgnify:CR=1 FL=1
MTRFLSSNRAAILLLFALGGCTWAFQGSNGEIPEMHKNLSRTVDIQTGVIQGDLAKAQAAAEWLLSRQDQSTLPPDAAVFEEEILGYASSISTETELRAVAAQTGRIAAACGSCHQATNGGPSFVVGTKNPTGDSQEAQMLRHLWAADRMWEGLVGPSDDAWMAGARAMAETQPVLARAYRASVGTEQSEGFLAEVNRLAQEALTASDLPEKAEVYGQMLDACNRCHTQAGIQVNR